MSHSRPATVKKEIAATADFVGAIKESLKSGGWPGNRQEPLWHGEHKRLFVSDGDIKKVQPIPVEMRLGPAVRERFFNKQLHDYIKQQGYRQVLILGSGFDTHAYKKNKHEQQGKKNANVYAEVKFFEIDCEESLTRKERIYDENGVDKNAVYVKANYLEEDFITLLKQKGFNCNAPTLILWEGNSFYLPKEKIPPLFATIKSSIPNAVILFDHFTSEFINEGPKPTSCYFGNTHHAMKMWVTGFNTQDVAALASESGMTVVLTKALNECKREYGVSDHQGDDDYLVSVLKT